MRETLGKRAFSRRGSQKHRVLGPLHPRFCESLGDSHEGPLTLQKLGSFKVLGQLCSARTVSEQAPSALDLIKPHWQCMPSNQATLAMHALKGRCPFPAGPASPRKGVLALEGLTPHWPCISSGGDVPFPWDAQSSRGRGTRTDSASARKILQATLALRTCKVQK